MRWLLAGALVVLAACGSDPTSESPPVDQVRLEWSLTPHGIAWAELGEGEPLLMLNGTGSPMSEWDPALLGGLADSHRVIVFDYPGLGESTAPAASSFRSMAADAVQLLNDLAVDRTAVLGWSMGGFVTQELLRHHDDRISRAVLVGTNPGGTPTVLGPRWVQRADSDPEGGDRTYLRTNYPMNECAQDAGRAFLQRLEHAVDAGDYPLPTTPSKTYEAMVRAEGPWLSSDRNLRQLADVRNDVLVLVGAEDVITPLQNSRILAERIPGAHLSVFVGAGHSVLFQEPARGSAVVGEFLAGRQPPEAVVGECGGPGFS